MKQRVGISEYRVGRPPIIFKAAGLGSCLAVSLYDAGTGLGGLAHCLLPGRCKETSAADSAKYIGDAIVRMRQALLDEGAGADHLIAKLAGGANMFEADFLSQLDGIGARSAQSARALLSELEIPLVAEDVGGNRGRTVEFDLTTGELTVSWARDPVPLRL